MLEPYFETILSAFSAHPYPVLFIGLLLAGESILLPAIYLAIAGKLSMPHVLAITAVATTIADVAWFYVGRHLGQGGFRWLVSERVLSKMVDISKPFEAHMAKALFISKFVYGTRTAAQVLAGARGMHWKRYVMVNFLGVMALSLSLIALGYSVDFTAAGFQATVHATELAFLAFVVVATLGHVAVGKFVKKKWYQQ